MLEISPVLENGKKIPAGGVVSGVLSKLRVVTEDSPEKSPALNSSTCGGANRARQGPPAQAGKVSYQPE